MKGRIIDFVFGLNRKQRITVEIDNDFRNKYDLLKDFDVEVTIQKYRQKRSKTANAYFHLLVNKVSQETGESEEQIKKRLVLSYGVHDTDDEGNTIGFKLPATVDVEKIYPYVKCFDTRVENGKKFNCYLVYKRTSDMNTKEMSNIIDAIVSEAKELGIETDTPEEIAKQKAIWAEYERSN